MKAPTSLLAGLLLAAVPPAALAHDGARHEAASAPQLEVRPMENASTENASTEDAPTPFPLDLDTRISLVNEAGVAVTNADYAGDHLLVFFGFARCKGICPTAFEAMGEAAARLGGEGLRLRALVISIDPANEPPAVMAEELPKLHPRLEGLTGSAEAVEAVMQGFQVEAVYKGENALYGVPNYAHGSFIYLLGPDSALLSVLPPVLPAGQIADIARRYISRPES